MPRKLTNKLFSQTRLVSLVIAVILRGYSKSLQNCTQIIVRCIIRSVVGLKAQPTETKYHVRNGTGVSDCKSANRISNIQFQHMKTLKIKYNSEVSKLALCRGKQLSIVFREGTP